MVHFSEYSGRVEEIFLPEDGPTELGAGISIADAEWAEQEARRAGSQPELVLWTDGSRDENGAVGYAVVWTKGRSWAGRKAHMGFFREAYDGERAAIARAFCRDRDPLVSRTQMDPWERGRGWMGQAGRQRAG